MLIEEAARLLVDQVRIERSNQLEHHGQKSPGRKNKHY
jgi:hypothetical protein